MQQQKSKRHTSPSRSIPVPEPPRKKRSPLLPILLVIIAVAIGLTGFLMYRHDQSEKQKAVDLAADRVRFAQVEADMRAARDRIVTASGNPLNESASKSCNYTSVKYEKGELYCIVGYQLEYDVKNSEQFKNLSRTTFTAILSKDFRRPSNSNYFDDTLRTSKSASASIESREMSCKLHSELNEPLDGLDNDIGGAVRLVFNCNKNVNTAVYPLAEQ